MEKIGLDAYPEFSKPTLVIADKTCELVAFVSQCINSTMPYKGQFLLEMVIKELQSRI